LNLKKVVYKSSFPAATLFFTGVVSVYKTFDLFPFDNQLEFWNSHGKILVVVIVASLSSFVL